MIINGKAIRVKCTNQKFEFKIFLKNKGYLTFGDGMLTL